MFRVWCVAVGPTMYRCTVPNVALMQPHSSDQPPPIPLPTCFNSTLRNIRVIKQVVSIGPPNYAEVTQVCIIRCASSLRSTYYALPTQLDSACCAQPATVLYSTDLLCSIYGAPRISRTLPSHLTSHTSHLTPHTSGGRDRERPLGLRCLLGLNQVVTVSLYTQPPHHHTTTPHTTTPPVPYFQLLPERKLK